MQDSGSDGSRMIGGLIQGGHTIAMVMTMVDGQHTSRPVTVIEVHDSDLKCLVDQRSEWVHSVSQGHAVAHVSIADERHNTYLSLNGHATITRDAAELVRLWSPLAKPWFDGPTDPNLAVLTFTTTDGQYWDGPDGKIASAIGLARAIVKGDDAPLGEHGTVVGG